MVCTVEPLSLVDDSNVDEAGEVPIEEDVVSSVELLSLVDDSNVIVVVVIADISVVIVDLAVVVGSDSVVELNREVCVCWLVVSSALEVGISVVDEVNSDVLCSSVEVDGEKEEVTVV